MNKARTGVDSRREEAVTGVLAGEKYGNVKFFLDKRDGGGYAPRFVSNGPARQG